MKFPFGMTRSTVYSQTGGDPFNMPKPSAPSPAAMNAEAHNMTNDQSNTAALSQMLKVRQKKSRKQRY